MRYIINLVANVARRPLEADSLTFEVDAALLRELGERLVGKPHIALAELIKNSFDADAETAWVIIDQNEIVVEDDGHGMSRPEFERFWMRVGSPHKQNIPASRRFGRPLTGSKGVGRLAVQFLGRQVEVKTTSDRPNPKQLDVSVNWDKAIQSRSLTEVEAQLRVYEPDFLYCGHSKHGTRVRITHLVHEWHKEAVARVANELWMLVPPDNKLAGHQAGRFYIEVKSSRPEIQDAFVDRLNVIDNLWHARVRGVLAPQKRPKANVDRPFEITWQFRHGKSGVSTFSIPNCILSAASFDLKIFSLFGRQGGGVRIADAREYIAEFGGAHLFDSQFRLPYYGLEHDWLNIERDHSHRLSTSRLLPESLRVSGGMSSLPTQSRILGQVLINTSQERKWAEAAGAAAQSDYLQIQVSRDRLVENRAYEQLITFVRTGLDLYAMEEAKRKLADAQKVIRSSTPRESLASIAAVIRRYRHELPAGVAKALEQEIGQVLKAQEAERESFNQQSNLLGALATSGMMALSFDHEYARQLTGLSEIASRLEKLADELDSAEVLNASFEITNWIEQTKEIRRIFSSIADDENRTRRLSLRARQVLEAAASQVRPLLRDTQLRWDNFDDDIQLPLGTYAEWLTVFQNVFVNASNAMLDCNAPVIAVTSTKSAGRITIRIQDTGVGVDIEKSSRLFEPMVREVRISPQRRSLAAGGSGLGLMIVRQILTSLDCAVRFAKPDRGYATALEIGWTS